MEGLLLPLQKFWLGQRTKATSLNSDFGAPLATSTEACRTERLSECAQTQAESAALHLEPDCCMSVRVCVCVRASASSCWLLLLLRLVLLGSRWKGGESKREEKKREGERERERQCVRGANCRTRAERVAHARELPPLCSWGSLSFSLSLSLSLSGRPAGLCEKAGERGPASQPARERDRPGSPAAAPERERVQQPPQKREVVVVVDAARATSLLHCSLGRSWRAASRELRAARERESASVCRLWPAPGLCLCALWLTKNPENLSNRRQRNEQASAEVARERRAHNRRRARAS